MKRGKVRTGPRQRSLVRSMLIVSIWVVAIFLAVSLTATPIAFHFIFSRQALQAETLEPRYDDALGARYPRRLLSVASGGRLLQGYLYETADPNGVVLIAHGFWGGADTHLAAASYFLDHGWTVFAFDGTGCRESEGDSVLGLGQMKRDVEAALDTLRAEPATADLPIVLYGHSMGGYAVAAALDDDRVAGAVSVSAFDAPISLMCARARGYVGFLADIEYPFLWLQSCLTYGADADLSAASVVDGCDKPILIVQGSADTTVPEEQSLYARRDEIGNPNAVYLWVDEPPRNTHSTIWLSADAAAYKLALTERLDALRAQYGGALPDDVRSAFFQEIDRARLDTLDEPFMNAVHAFLLAAARG